MTLTLNNNSIMKLKFTLLVTMIFGLMSLVTNPAMAQDEPAQPETASGPKLKIVSGFKGGSYYQMA
ncbi:MAG: hypothetical protein JXR34_07250, partial [Bacteroidales bacterium]|nr:hypothetical protein [Bacteroidales bacterium]